MQVVQRYGGRCAFCESPVSEWLHAAHLAGDAEQGSSAVTANTYSHVLADETELDYAELLAA